MLEKQKEKLEEVGELKAEIGKLQSKKGLPFEPGTKEKVAKQMNLVLYVEKKREEVKMEKQSKIFKACCVVQRLCQQLNLYEQESHHPNSNPTSYHSASPAILAPKSGITNITINGKPRKEEPNRIKVSTKNIDETLSMVGLKIQQLLLVIQSSSKRGKPRLDAKQLDTFGTQGVLNVDAGIYVKAQTFEPEKQPFEVLTKPPTFEIEDPKEKQILKEMQLIYAEVKGKKTQKKAPPQKKRPAYC